ncbi:MAG: hypothetical protein RO469_02665 [Thermincola sp.]|nr:hypothetical protein [Thermincola sp.]
MGKRQCIENMLKHVMLRLDTTRYFFDRPSLVYQPLPWININHARREIGTAARMSMIGAFLQEKEIEGGVVIDIGCNVGFFSLSLMERGFFVYGIDADERNLRIAEAASRRVKDKGGSFNPIRLLIDEQNAAYLPKSSVTVCFSIWHHWVRHYGLDRATKILSTLWAGTQTVMFFDTGESEMPENYNLPFDQNDPKDWLKTYLSKSCPGGLVMHLGLSQAFAPKNSKANTEIVYRNLFAVYKG